jgi:hypothetical protein
MSNYRHNDKPPVAYYMKAAAEKAAAMHLEIKALHKLLLAAALDQGVSPEDAERSIVRQIEILREEEA